MGCAVLLHKTSQAVKKRSVKFHFFTAFFMFYFISDVTVMILSGSFVLYKSIVILPFFSCKILTVSRFLTYYDWDYTGLSDCS